MVVNLWRRVSNVNLVSWESLHDAGAKLTPRTFKVFTEERSVSKRGSGSFEQP